MLPEINMRYGVAAALLAWIIALPEVYGSAPSAPDDGLPDAGEVVAAYLQLRQWADMLDLPGMDDPQARLPLEGASGVTVQLRRFGRVVGSASVLQGEHDLLARRTLGRALGDVLGDPAVAALPEDVLDEIGSALTLELEVAGRPVPMLGRSYQRIARDLQPGLDGVAMRRGDQWAMLFPSRLRASNTAGNIASRLPGLAAELGLPAHDLSRLIDQHGVSIYRIRTVHLAQREPDGFPFETLRGDRLVPAAAVTRARLTGFADDLAAHVLNRIVHDDRAEQAMHGVQEPIALGLLGDYRAVSDSFGPLQAPPLDQALTSLALSRYAAAPGVDRQLASLARSQARKLLVDLAEIEDTVDNPAVAAAVIYACAELEDDDVVKGLRDAAVAAIVAASEAPEFSGMSAALLAGAKARLLHDGHEAIERTGVRAAIDAAWDALPEHQHVALLPWIGWAELDYANAVEGPIVRADDLRRLHDIIEATRVIMTDDEHPADVRGGFALADRFGSHPTAQTTRPAAWFATVLNHREITGMEESSLALGRHLQTMRFLMQLSVREEILWSVRNPDRARGGIRAATWDSNMPTAAQAMALITAAHTLEALTGR